MHIRQNLPTVTHDQKEITLETNLVTLRIVYKDPTQNSKSLDDVKAYSRKKSKTKIMEFECQKIGPQLRYKKERVLNYHSKNNYYG